MSDEKKATVVQALVFGQTMVEARIIPGVADPVTASGVPYVRTVTTGLTSGSVNIRYVPRPAQPNSGTSTNS